jgi:FkbM family methyltransferase
MNDIEKYLRLLENFEPFSGYVPKGFLVDFVGGLTDAASRTMWGVDPAKEGGRYTRADRPTVNQADPFFEAAAWLEAACDARGTYTMITLGACYGGQAIGAYRALQRVNPMPAKLVAVEADAENFTWLQKNFRDNGLDPDQHWLLNCAVSDSNNPVLFPMGSGLSGANDCTATNHRDARLGYARQIIEDPNLAERVSSLIVDGDTGVVTNLVPGWDLPARIKFVSAVTVGDVLSPFDRVDLLDADIQGSERTAFPPAMDLIKARVKRVQIGTHGGDMHEELLQALAVRRFEIIFNYEPTTQYETPWGSFRTSDGIITARNLDL